MLYADDACIFSRSPRGLAKMVDVNEEVCRTFALTVFEKKTETRCMSPPRTLWTRTQGQVAGQTYKQVQSLNLPGGPRDENPGHVH